MAEELNVDSIIEKLLAGLSILWLVIGNRGKRRCFWMGGGGGVILWATQPIPRGVWGHAFPGNLFYLYVLKSILVHSETSIINGNYTAITEGCGPFHNMGGGGGGTNPQPHCFLCQWVRI